MTAIPFIYFTLLSCWLYLRRRELDMAVAISMIYAVSGFFTILYEDLNLRGFDTRNYEVSLFPTILYCTLLTMCLLPFIMFSNRRIAEIKPVRNVRLLKITAWAAFIWFVISALLSLPLFILMLTSDMAEMRGAIYRGEGEDSFMIFLPPYIRMPLALTNLAFGCYWIFVFLAFYCLLIQRLPIKYFWLFIIASLSGPWIGILGADRSRSTYWIISVVITYLFYRPFMSAKLKRIITSIMLILIGTTAVYLSMMTVSRFDKSDDGAFGAIIDYLGQNFVNFCYFFDTFDSPWTTLSLIFPFTSQYILGEQIVGGAPIQEHLTDLTGKELGVFYTFIGHIMVSAGRAIVIVWCIVYMVLSTHILRKYKRRTVSLHTAFCYMLLASVVYLGLWVFFYSSPSLTFSAVCFLVLTKMMGTKTAR